MKNFKKTLVFDFDGTIVDIMAQKKMIVDIFNNLSDEIGSKKIAENDVERIRGFETRELIKNLEIPLLKLPHMVKSFKQEAKKNIDLLKPISGMDLALKKLIKNDYKLGILTSNDKPHVSIFLKKNNIDKYFNFIYSGRDIFGKDKVMKKMMKEQNLKADEIIYFGDETRDIIASKKVGFQVMAVTWGLNNRQVLERYNPDFLIDDPSEILENLQK